MLGRLTSNPQQSLLAPDLALMLDPNHKLVRLAKQLPWDALEAELAGFYATSGRPSIPIRVMAAMLLLQRMFSLSDERLVEEWTQNPYWQHFSGMERFQWKVPCVPSELVKFRQRIGPEGCEKILAWTIQAHQARSAHPGAKHRVQTDVVIVDSTVQEKNITTPRDHKLYRRVAERILAFAAAEGVRLRRTYRRTLRRLVLSLRTANFPKAKAKARKTTKRLKTIAGALRRDFGRKITEDRLPRYQRIFGVMDRILTQGIGGPDRVYSLHEPEAYCIAKGKDHKFFEFGTKASIVIDAQSGVIVAAMNHAKNIYDGHTIGELTEQMRWMTGKDPKTVVGDQGYKGAEIVASLKTDGIELVTPVDLKRTDKHTPAGRRIRRLLRRRARVEPVIGHLKSDHRLGRNFLHGQDGDEMNLLLAAAGWNLRKLLRFLWLWAQAAVAGALRRMCSTDFNAERTVRAGWPLAA